MVENRGHNVHLEVRCVHFNMCANATNHELPSATEYYNNHDFFRETFPSLMDKVFTSVCIDIAIGDGKYVATVGQGNVCLMQCHHNLPLITH